jgi:hypothetical protein
LPRQATGYAAGMGSDTADERATTRAEPLPEERAVQRGDEDRTAEAAEILRESEDRIAAVTEADAPGDAAAQHRRSEETTEP